MSKWVKAGLMIVMILALVLTSCTSAKKTKSGQSKAPAGEKSTITFGVTPWTSTIPPTQVARLILEDMGYTVKLQNADAGVVYTGLARGDIDVFMDAWLPDMHRNYMEKYGDSIDDTAVSYPNGELGWVVPATLKGINSIEDLKGKEGLFGGKIYGIEDGAGMSVTSRKLIEDYGLNLNYVASSESGMLAQAKREISQKNPVLFLGWRPHPMFFNWDLTILKDPKGYFKTSEVHVLTNKEFKSEAPKAYAFLKKWSIPVGDVERMITELDKGKEASQVAREWIEKNQDKVNKMLGK